MPPRTVVCGTTVEPDHSIDPDALAVAEQLLQELGVPRRVKFTPNQLAADVGGSARGWRRECELRAIGAVRIPGGWVIPYARLVAYFAARQNVVALN